MVDWKVDMPKRAKDLTAVEVKRLTATGWHAVGTVAGLGLKVSPTGTRAWVLRVVVGTKRREMGLGGYPDVPLADAHAKARVMRAEIEQGVDPIEKRLAVASALRAAQTAGLTFEQCAAAYITAHAPAWKNPKHRQQWENTLATYAGPVIGAMLVRHVETPHVLAVLEPIWMDKTETASRLRGRIESVLDWATTRGQREGLNPARWRGHLDTLLPEKSKVSKVKHHAAMPWREIGQFMPRLRAAEGVGARCLEFAILTAARSGEVRGATWSEINLDAALWCIPADRMKMDRDHRVPLSPAAVKLLKSLPRIVGNDLVFPSSVKRCELSDATLGAILARMELPFTQHGFRSTFRDWAAEATAYPGDAVELALAHVVKNKVEAAYRRGDMLDKRVRLMADWADWCARTTTGEVIGIGSARAA